MTDKIVLGNIASFQNDATAATQYNSNNVTIIAGLDNTLSRDGTSPNQMGANLDMNSNQILNLPAPSSSTSPARLVDITPGSVVQFQSAANSIKGNNTGSTGPTTDLTASQVNGLLQTLMVAAFVKSVNFNSANTDTTITLPTLPVGGTSYSNLSVRISNASAVNTTATWGLFTGAGGTGVAIATAQAGAISTIAANTAGNMSTFSPTNFALTGVSSLFFRVQNAQGAPCTADVTIQLIVQY